MENQPLISVIVPIYNVEKYLGRCIESIVNQTYKNTEIILVDDGSPDNCPEMCDDWEKKDERIKVIHKENGGLSDARNAGLEIASGDYISFIDSDDYISTDFFSLMINAMIKEKSDIVECNVIKFGGNEVQINFNDKLSIKNYSTKEALKLSIQDKDFHQHVWNKLYKSELVLDLMFPVGKLNEDEYWTYKVIGRAKKLTKINKPMYYYYQRSSSIINSKYNVKRLDGVLAIKERLEFINKFFPELSDVACESYLETCFYHYQILSRNKDIDKERKHRDYLYKEYCDNYSLNSVSLKSKKQQFWMKSFKRFPNLICNMRNLLKIGF